MSENIKDIHDGSSVRMNSIIYKIKSIEKSPCVLETGVEQFIFSLEFVEMDFGEMLADMGKR